MNFNITAGVLDSEQWKQKIAKDRELAEIRREGIRNEYHCRSYYNLTPCRYKRSLYDDDYDDDIWGGGSHPSWFFD